MTLQQPRQGPGQTETFSNLVRGLLQEKGWNAAFLAKESNLSKTTVSRILRDSNDKGSTYQPTANIVMAVCCAFKMDTAEGDKLLLAAFPQWAIWREGLEQHLSVHEVNCRLYEQGLPLLGNANDE